MFIFDVEGIRRGRFNAAWNEMNEIKLEHEKNLNKRFD